MNFNFNKLPRNSPKSNKNYDIKLIKSKFLKNYQIQRNQSRELNNIRIRKIDEKFLNSGENSEFENFSDDDVTSKTENHGCTSGFELDSYQLELEQAWNAFYLQYFNGDTQEWELDIDQEEFAQLEQFEQSYIQSALQSYNNLNEIYETNFNCLICSSKLFANYPYLQCNRCELSYTQQLLESIHIEAQNHSSSCNSSPFFIKESEFSISLVCEDCDLFKVYQ